MRPYFISMSRVLIFLFACGSCLAQADFLAYAVTEKKGEFPLPEDLKILTLFAGKHLVNFRWGDYDGPKLRLGVLEVENTVKSSGYNKFKGGEQEQSSERVPLGSIDALVIDALVNSGRFTLVERGELEQLMEEQNLTESGRTADSGPSSGKMLGARFLVKVVVTEYEPKYKSKSLGLGAISLGVLGGVGVGSEQSLIRLTVRLIDPESREIIFSQKVEGVIGKKGFVASGAKGRRGKAQGATFRSLSNTPIGNAVMVAVNAGVYELIKAMGNQPLKGQVVAVRKGRLILNQGRGQVEPGDEFRAYAKGETFIDPATGLSLGSEQEELGLVRVVEVKKQFCYAEAVDFEADQLVTGDEVVSTADLKNFRFADRWQGPFPKLKKKRLKSKKGETSQSE